MFTKGHFWKDYNQEERSILAEDIFSFYREKGFPHYNLSVSDRLKEYESFYKYCQNSEIIQDSVIKQSMHGLALCWTHFPFYTEIKCGNMRTPMEVFQDDVLFRKAIDKRLKYGTYLANSGILKTLKTFSGTQCVSNFRPTAAYAIYDR